MAAFFSALSWHPLRLARSSVWHGSIGGGDAGEVVDLYSRRRDLDGWWGISDVNEGTRKARSRLIGGAKSRGAFFLSENLLLAKGT